MPEKTEAQKRAQKKYMSSFVEIKVRMTPEKRSIIQGHAQTMGESATTFINRAVDETMERDSGGTHPTGPQKALELSQGVGVVSLPSEAMETAQVAAEAAGEAVPQFIARAISETAEREKEISK